MFATTGTLASRKFAALVQREAPEVRILLRPCPEWVALVERGELEGPAPRAAVEAPVRELREAGADVLVLGCTHFLPGRGHPGRGRSSVPLLETGAPVARWLRHQLQERDLQADGGCGALELETTGDPATLARLAGLLLGGDFQAAQTPPAWR